MGTRREARERALSLCYELDVRDRDADTLLADLPLPPDDYAERLVRGVDAEHATLDATIDAASEHWSVDRMAVVDRVLLRIGCYELMHCDDVPAGAVISEAVELAKRYSTEESGRFVNGVLAHIARDTRSGEVDDVAAG